MLGLLRGPRLRCTIPTPEADPAGRELSPRNTAGRSRAASRQAPRLCLDKE